jgi:hypothetical protein
LLAVLGLERHILVTDVAVLLEALHRRLTLLLVGEKADLPELLPHQLVERVAEEIDHEGIGVDDLPVRFLEDEDGILRCLEQPPVALLRRFEWRLLGS